MFNTQISLEVLRWREKCRMIKRLANVELAVNDQNKAVDSTSVLGFEKRTDISPPGAARWATVAPEGQDVEISLFQAGSPPQPGLSKLKPGVSAAWSL